MFKRANEETAGVYWADHGIASIGLRPHTVYGPGRDQGVTSAPTKAMLAAAAGASFRIPYGGRAELQYAKDVARAFILASRATAEGATVHDPPGEVASMGEIVAAIHAVAPDSAERVTFDDVPPMGVPEKGDARSFTELLGDARGDAARDRRGRHDRPLPRAPGQGPRAARGATAVSRRPPSRCTATSRSRCATARSPGPTSGGAPTRRPAPAILLRTPYGKERAVPIATVDPAQAADAGFVVVVQDVRGKGASDGSLRAVRQRGPATAPTRSPGSPPSPGATAGW